MPLTRRRKRLLLIAFLVLSSLIVAAVAMKYFPFTKLIRMPAADAEAFGDSARIRHDAPNALFFDFETAPGKEMPSGCYEGIAHSGRYAVKAFGQNSFSLAVERTAGQIGIENLTSVALSAWIYVFPTGNEVKGSLVFTASNSLGVNVCWHGVGLVEPEIPREKWFKISGSFDLTSVKFDSATRIQVYFWNNSNTDILIDDYTVVFGGAKERRGDTTLVDLTRQEGYQPRFNYPPFQVKHLEREAAPGLPLPGKVLPGDRLVAGDFFGMGRDAMLCLHENEFREGWIYCQSDKSFRDVRITGDRIPAGLGQITGVGSGRFLNGTRSQILVTGTSGWLLGELSGGENVCSDKETPTAGFRIISGPNPASSRIVSGDFDGNRIMEVLYVEQDGTWELCTIMKKPDGYCVPEALTKGSQPLPGWQGSAPENGLHTGKFLPGPADQLLVISVNEKGEQVYTIRRWNRANTSWDPAPGMNDSRSLVTVGYDTLRPGDQFLFPGRIWNAPSILRYNRDWRFDLKTIRFADSTFSVLNTIDFSGFDNDRNPKYYEKVTLLPGHFLSPASWSLLVWGYNDPAHGYAAILPDVIHLYTPKSE